LLQGRALLVREIKQARREKLRKQERALPPACMIAVAPLKLSLFAPAAIGKPPLKL
jgi:hypothetical protein